MTPPASIVHKSRLGRLILASATLPLALGGVLPGRFDRWMSEPSVPAEALGADPSSASPIDGEYALLDPDPPEWWSCLRCADYRPSGGAWVLRFGQGEMSLGYQVTGWASHASFVISGDTLDLFDDPVCPWDHGRYSWRLDGPSLTLEPLEDGCAFGLRAENLGRGRWESCRPPNLRAAVSDAWPRPEGCPGAPSPSWPIAPPPDGLTVTARPGDARLGSASIQAFPANPQNQPAPIGVAIAAAPAVVRYGLYVVLWRDGPWVEAAFEDTPGPIGVQFWGPSTMGAARVLLDGIEVWRGQVVPLGDLRGQYGGYIEVGGLAPGAHLLRVERLDLDTRPVRVMFFGLG